MPRSQKFISSISSILTSSKGNISPAGSPKVMSPSVVGLTTGNHQRQGIHTTSSTRAAAAFHQQQILSQWDSVHSGEKLSTSSSTTNSGAPLEKGEMENSSMENKGVSHRGDTHSTKGSNSQHGHSDRRAYHSSSQNSSSVNNSKTDDKSSDIVYDMTDDVRPNRNWHYNMRTNEMEPVNEDF